MSIDFFTLFIQIFNFFILIFILNFLVYKPLLRIVQERKNNIKNKIDFADSKIIEAEKLKEEYQKKINEFENFCNNEKTKLTNEINDKRVEQLDKLKLENLKNKKEFENQLEESKEKILNVMINEICIHLDSFVSNLFLSLTDTDINKALFKKFLKDFEKMDNNKLNSIYDDKEKDLIFISNYELNQEELNNLNKIIVGKNIKNKVIFKKYNTNNIGCELLIDNTVICSNLADVIDQFKKQLNNNYGE